MIGIVGYSMRQNNDPIEAVISQSQIKLYHWSELKGLPKRKYLIKGLLDQAGMSVVFGASNSGKTFLGIDIACYVALGRSWSGKKTRQGKVIYIAAEGGLGIEERLEAFRLHHKLQEYAEIYIIPSNICLCKDDVTLAELIEKLSGIEDIKLIIVDTLARSMGSGDENSPSDMGSFIQSCDIIRQETKAHVMVIHHSGKDGSKGARGHSSLKAAVDTEIQVSQSNDVIQVLVTKQRDGRNHDRFHFELMEYEVGKDEDGDPIISCALVASDVSEEIPRISGQAAQTYNVLTELMLDDGSYHTPKKGMTAQKCVRLDDFKECFMKAGIVDSDNQDSSNKAFLRAKNKLKSLGYMGEWDKHVWLTDKQDTLGQTIKTNVAG